MHGVAFVRVWIRKDVLFESVRVFARIRGDGYGGSSAQDIRRGGSVGWGRVAFTVANVLVFVLRRDGGESDEERDEKLRHDVSVPIDGVRVDVDILRRRVEADFHRHRLEERRAGVRVGRCAF